MPTAVPSFFSSSALQASAPVAKPSSPQAPEGSSDFQNMLDQAKPRAQKTQDNGADATAKSHQADKPKQKPAVSKKGKAQAAQKKANVDPANDEGESGDTETKDATATQTATAPPPIADPSQTKTPSPARKTTEAKNADDPATADASQQVMAAQSALKVQPVDAKKQQDQQSGQQQPQDVSVQAVESDQPDNADDAQPGSVKVAADPSSSAAKSQPAASARQTAAKEPARQKAGIQAGKNLPDQSPAVSASAANAASQLADADDDSDSGDATQTTTTASAASDTGAAHAAAHAAESSFADVLGAIQSPAAKSPATDGHGIQQPSAPAAPPEAQFAQANHSTIISGIHGQLLPAGGTMQVRLDPPELGALSVIVRVHEGVMSASFETSNDQATRMLSHTLTQLKSSLEAQGVSVGKLHVQQSPKGQQSDLRDENRPSQDNRNQDSAAQREQQRREMLRRMWRRLSGGQDPLDLVA